MTANEIWKEEAHQSQFDRLLNALETGICCTIGELTMFSSFPVASPNNNLFSSKISHRKHNHGEIIEAIVRVRLSTNENLLGHHVDAIVQIANMEYIYKDCNFTINAI